ncbi:MAG: type II toxin-antitoxin system RelE/ParE family toxin [Candidatus Brocadiia bacterium]
MAQEQAGQGNRWRIIECPHSSGSAGQFIREELEQHQRKSVVAYLRKCREHPEGPWWNTYKFKKLTGTEDIYEMKPRAQVRLLGFLPADQPKTFVVTNCFIKKQRTTPRREIRKAERARRRYLEAIEGG